MFKFSGLPIGLLALTVAAPVFAQSTTTPTSPTSPSGTMSPAMPTTPPRASITPQANLVDINSATAEQLKALPGVSDADSTKIIRGRPYADAHQLVSRHV